MKAEKFAVFTMDVESFTDTECVSRSSANIGIDLLDGFDEYIRILDKYNIKSTLFTVAALAPKMQDRLKRCIANGHRLALHSFEHSVTTDCSPQEFRKNMQHAKTSLSSLFNTEILGFRAPFFGIDDERINILKDLGFKYDSSHLGFAKARHSINPLFEGFKKLSDDIFCCEDFFEFGLSKEKVFGQPFPISGGGYLRLTNWEIMKSVVKRYIETHDYYVFYLHPFELTRQKIPNIPKLNIFDKIYLNVGIKTYGQHIEELILMLKESGYRFVTFEELSEIIATKN